MPYKSDPAIERDTGVARAGVFVAWTTIEREGRGGPIDVRSVEDQGHIVYFVVLRFGRRNADDLVLIRLAAHAH